MKHLLLPFLLAVPIAAQSLAGEFSPQVAPFGTPVTFTITDSTGQGVNLSSPCGWYAIFQGSQGGPQLQLGQSCLQVIVPVAPGGSATFTWDQRDVNGQVPAGQYWFRARVWDSGINRQLTDWFCLSIVNPGEPQYTVQAPLQLGQTAQFAIAAPQQPNAIYFTALSFSSNNPVTAAGLATCLSLPIFTGLQNGFGALDAQGNSAGVALPIPNIPALQNTGLHSQAVLFTTAGAVLLTNDISMVLR